MSENKENIDFMATAAKEAIKFAVQSFAKELITDPDTWHHPQFDDDIRRLVTREIELYLKNDEQIREQIRESFYQSVGRCLDRLKETKGGINGN